jgi:S-ribosylhomocysteine lyase
MNKIASFTVNHLNLLRGVYVSRSDKFGGQTVTTFDIRITRPNREPVMNTAEIHAIEHLGATFMRNHEQFGEKTVYFGPMGCRTGFYLLLAGEYAGKEILPTLINLFEFIRDYKGEIPGASPKDCGNYLDLNLPMAKYTAKKFLDEVLYDIRDENLVYPAE